MGRRFDILFLPVGEMASICDLKVMAVEEPSDHCLRCALRGYANCEDAFGPCDGEYRPDGKNVIYLNCTENETDE